MTRGKPHQRGAALLTAMIIVVLIVTLASSMVWQQWRAVQVEVAERARAQSAWILSGALDWARLILREDARGQVDHLGEPWAVPLAEARLSTFLAADSNNTDDGPEAFLSGSITDAQSRYNVTNLVDRTKGIVDPFEFAAFERLCQNLGVDAAVASLIAGGLRDALAPAGSGTGNAPLLPESVAQLGWLGVDAASLELLAPYIVILPIVTPVNVNTASAEVLVAVIPGNDHATAERLLQVRQRTPFEDLTRFWAQVPALAPQAGATTPQAKLSVNSAFFEVRGRLRLSDRVLEESSLCNGCKAARSMCCGANASPAAKTPHPPTEGSGSPASGCRKCLISLRLVQGACLQCRQPSSLHSMSTLVVHIPQRRRLRSRSPGSLEPEASRLGTEYVYVTSPDGLALQSQGQCAASLLPKATTVIAVLSDADVSWHRITLPKAPAARLRAALGGVLEEALLEDPADVHLAIAPQSSAGQPTWVAAVAHDWLKAEIAALEKADVFVDRIVPMAWPDDPPIGHFAELHAEEGESTEGIALHWAHADGVASVRLQGGLARSIVPSPAPQGTRWSATPGAAAAAEQWLGTSVNVFPPGHRMLQAARTLWNLRQFDLARRTRGARAARDSLRKLFSPEWRPVRFGLGALVLAQILGLNLWAWHQQSAIAAKRVAMQGLVKSAFPKVSELDIQRDAAAVMQRETTNLRALAGRPGDTDLEAMLQAASSAWPAERPATDSLRFEPGKLTLSAGGWNDAQIEQFRSVLRPGGWQVESNEGRLTLTRARIGAPS